MPASFSPSASFLVSFVNRGKRALSPEARGLRIAFPGLGWAGWDIVKDQSWACSTTATQL
jgi:hypothetical protein